MGNVNGRKGGCQENNSYACTVYKSVNQHFGTEITSLVITMILKHRILSNIETVLRQLDPYSQKCLK